LSADLPGVTRRRVDGGDWGKRAMPAINEATRKWWILAAMGGVAGLIMLDETVVAVALPTIRHDLGMSQVAAHWVISAYFLLFTVFAAAGGKLGDVAGFRTLLLVGSSVFGLASLACGFAEGGGLLIAARAAQGIGAALIFPATIAMVTIAFPKEQRGMAIGTLAAVGTMFLALGPLVGGFLTEIVSWRWIFWINVPIVLAIVAIVLVAWVDLPREGERARFDAVGLVALVAGLAMVVFAIMQGAVWGWTQTSIVALLAGGIVLMALFTLVEARRDKPLIDVDLFRIASFSACTLVLFVGQFSKIALIVFAALYLQSSVGMSPLDAGLALLVAVAAFPFLSPLVGRMADKFGARRPVLGGLALATLGTFWIGVVLAWDSYVLMLPGLIMWGLGMPFCYAPTMRAMANAVPQDKQGQIGGIVITARLLGGTFGMAIGSTLLATTGTFTVVFLATAGLMLAAVAVGYAAIETGEGETEPASPG
jgi:EmrB/QacA subfamily drug resistance transporter